MRIICTTTKGDLLLVELEAGAGLQGDGFIFNTATGKAGNTAPVGSLLNHGFWKPYTGDQNVPFSIAVTPKVAKYIRHEGSKWNVYAESGRRLGSYDTKGEAEERLAQIEWFKEHPEETTKRSEPTKIYFESSLPKQIKKAAIKPPDNHVEERAQNMKPITDKVTNNISDLIGQLAAGTISTVFFVDAVTNAVRWGANTTYSVGTRAAWDEYDIYENDDYDLGYLDFGDDDIEDFVSGQRGYIQGMAQDVIAGTLVGSLASNARGAMYASNLYNVYERSYGKSTGMRALQAQFDDGVSPDDAELPTIIWHTSQDEEVCPLCDDRDEEEYTEDDLPCWPGDGDFGEFCEGGINCRCWLEYVEPDGTSTSSKGIKKYRPDQAREPAGSPGSIGGRFASEDVLSSSTSYDIPASDIRNELNGGPVLGLWGLDIVSRDPYGYNSTSEEEESKFRKHEVMVNLAKELKNDPDFQKTVQQLIETYPSILDIDPYNPVSYDETEICTSELIKAWAHSSADSNLVSIALQFAAQKEFNLNAETRHLQKNLIYNRSSGELDPAFANMIPGMQKFLRAQYNQTQELFKQAGVTHVTAFRAIQFQNNPPAGLVFDDKVHNTSMAMQPISSWALRPEVTHYGGPTGDNAAPYGGILAARIPVERILSTTRTGFGSYQESEITVLGSGKDNAKFFGTQTGGDVSTDQLIEDIKSSSSGSSKRLTPPYNIDELLHNADWIKRPNKESSVSKSGFDPSQPRDERGRWTESDGGGDFKEFTSEEGYAWHKQNAKWAADLTEEDRAIVNNYVGFGYSEINRLLRGDPPTTFQNRPATEAERQAYLDGNSAGEIPKLPNGAYYDKWGSEVAERVPDPKRTEIAQRQIEKLDNLIATKGVVLKEPITTLRATYLPTATLEDFEVGKVITESGFTSVMVGDANGRYENYIAWGKAESLNQRFGTINHPENGLALGLKIQIPKGARVLDADAVRKHSDPDRETESELILPSGSRFRVKAVNTYAGVSRLSDFQTPYHEVILEYIPPTSEAVEQKNSVMKGADFDESKHPRNPAGSPNSTGGQFVSTDEGGNSTFLEKPNASDRIINSPILTIGVSDAELEALESYITIGYSDMNALLRKFNISIPSFELDYVIDEIKSLTNVLDRQSLPENVTVYRGTDSMLNKALKAGVGGIIDDNGFVSTTLDETYAKNFRSSHSYVRIQLPAGAKAGYSSTSIVDGRSEHEVILQRGSRFRVVSVSNAGIPTLQWLSASPAEIPAGTGKIAKSEDNRFVWSSEDIVWSNSSVTKGADFDESKHPRNPAGSPEGTGGEFVSVVNSSIENTKTAQNFDVSTVQDNDHDIYMLPAVILQKFALDLSKELGLDGKPTIGTAEDIKKAVAAGGIEVWRGFGKRAVEHIEQFKHGEHYVSKGGVDGTGIYTTSDESETHFYTDDLSTVTHMAIKPGAKILVGELVTPQFPDMKPFTLDEKERFKMVSAKIKEYEKSFPNARTAEGKERILYSMLLDPGISGMLSGYDAIKNGDHYLVLNRAALIVEEK